MQRSDLPRTLAGIRLEQQIARSAMSTISRGRDPADRTVAVKVLDGTLAQQPEQVARFVETARSMVGVEHPNLLALLAHGREGDEHYVVMEHLEGKSLAGALEAASNSAGAEATSPVWAHVVARAADGLQHLHESGFVHCDVTPGNLFITTAGGVKVIDFGLLRRPGPAAGRDGGRRLSGTYAYLAPERVRGGHVDRRADIFALAVILYEATTWRRLFKGATDTETLAKIERHEIRAPHLDVADYPRRLEGIVLRGLRRDPAGRQQTARELARELDDFIRSERREPVRAEEIAALLA